MKLNILKDTWARVPAKLIQRLFEEMIEKEADPSWRGQINLIFVDDRKIRRLNSKFRGKTKATDVLSFNLDSPDSNENIFGEVYISVDTAARQAKESRVPLIHE